jgi:hypothetical protein
VGELRAAFREAVDHYLGVSRPARRPDDKDLAVFDASETRVPGAAQGAKKGRQEAP